MLKKISKKVVKVVDSRRSYRTRYGREVRIICTNFGCEKYPVIAEVAKLESDDSILVQYTADGKAKYMPGRKYVRGFDLVEKNEVF